MSEYLPNEVTVDSDPEVKLIEFASPEPNQFHAINQFRVDTPGCAKQFIDKRPRKHNLLQAIARVNRVARNKQRDLIVDYIGLANHLIQALSIYAGEDQSDLDFGLKDVLSELPILEERYQRLLQHFKGAGIASIENFVHEALGDAEAEVKVMHAAVGSLKDINRRADFEVYLQMFLQYLNLILPNPAGHAYRGPARRLGYLLRMAKERYKDDSVNVADAGTKVATLISEHLISLGIDPKIPRIELLAENFVATVESHSKGDPEAKASAD